MNSVREDVRRPALRKRILHCIASMKGGGAERQLSYLCRGLAGAGWDVTVALLDSGPNIDQLIRTGIRVEILKHKTNYDPRIVWQLVKLIRRLQPDVVHTWLPFMNIVGGIATGLSGGVLLGSERNSERAYSTGWKDRLQLLVLSSRATAVIANSTAGLNYVQNHLKGCIGKYMIPNGFPISDIEAVMPASRQTMGVEQSAEVILFAGRFEVQKNLDDLFHALPLVFKVRPQAVAILCGNGSVREHWIDWVRQHNLADKIFFPGYVSDIWSWMMSSDVFVFPSLFEGQPNAVFEAMACQCPLVVSDIAEHRAFLDDECALLFQINSPVQFAEAIIETLNNRHAAALRVANARKRVSVYSVEAMVRSYEDMYLQLVNAEHTSRGSSLARFN